MATANGKHRSFPEGMRSLSTISDLKNRQLTEIVALMSLLDYEKLRGNSFEISKYLKNTSDAFRNVGCFPMVIVMASQGLLP